MPHQCVRCNIFYEDGATELLKGCACGGRLFFFIKKEKLDEVRKVADTSNLSQKEKIQIEDDIFDMIGSEIDKTKPVILDFESIQVLKPGTYMLDLVHLFKREPLIFKLEEGKYMIDLVESLGRYKKK